MDLPGNPIRALPARAHREFRAIRRQRATLRRLRDGSELQLHLGCGQKRLPGYINVDLHPSSATDYVGDLADLPCPPGSVARIEAYHVIEHIPRPQVADVLAKWRRVLRLGGVLVLECPDLEADMREALAGNEDRLFSIFGRQRFPGDAHHWGYTGASLTRELQAVGFRTVEMQPPQDYHAELEPCLRVEAHA